MSLARRWSGQDDFRMLFDAAAGRYGLPPALLYATAAVESGFKPDAQRGAESYGLMQVTPSTAHGLGYGGTTAGLLDPMVNVELGAKLLQQLYHQLGGNVAKVASAYNGGYRPSLGFGEVLAAPQRLCLAKDAAGKCVTWYDAKAGEFGNQPYVVKILNAYTYFAQYLAERDGKPAPNPATLPTIPGAAAGGFPWWLVGLGGLAAAAAAFFRSRAH